jgi:hypothetical protein
MKIHGGILHKSIKLTFDQSSETGSETGGRSRTRTADPLGVNEPSKSARANILRIYMQLKFFIAADKKLLQLFLVVSRHKYGTTILFRQKNVQWRPR